MVNNNLPPPPDQGEILAKNLNKRLLTTNQELEDIFNIASRQEITREENGQLKFSVPLKDGIAEDYAGVPSTRSSNVEFEKSDNGFNIFYKLDYSIHPIPNSDFSQDRTRTVKYTFNNSGDKPQLVLERFDNNIPDINLQRKKFVSEDRGHYFQITRGLDLLKKITTTCSNEIQGKTEEENANRANADLQGLTQNLLELASRDKRRPS